MRKKKVSKKIVMPRKKVSHNFLLLKQDTISKLKKPMQSDNDSSSSDENGDGSLSRP